MALQKSVTFTIISRSETFNGLETVIEALLQETNPASDLAPIQIVFRSLNATDAAIFVTGSKVTVNIGADIAKVTSVGASTLTTLK